MSTEYPPQSYALVSFPNPHILLVTLNRPTVLNCLNSDAQYELDALFTWYDNTPSLRCAILTGAGRAFCTGADLKEWNTRNAAHTRGEAPDTRPTMPRTGFGGLSRRHGKKPIIAAVNGLAYGGGMEMVANLDLIIAAREARFALTEAKRGVVALAGSLPRLARTIGRSRAMEMALTGRVVTAEEMREWGLVNEVVEEGNVVERAVEVAREIVFNSPDSVIVSRAGVLGGWEDGSAENASRLLVEVYEKRLEEGENSIEGVKAFVEKRRPNWVDSKL